MSDRQIHEQFIREDAVRAGYDQEITDKLVAFNEAALDLFDEFKAKHMVNDAVAVKEGMTTFFTILQQVGNRAKREKMDG